MFAQLVWQRTLPTPRNPAARASHNATATDFLYVVATARASLHILALPPIEVVLVTRLIAALILVEVGGAIGAEFEAVGLALGRQVSTDIAGLGKVGETRDPVTIQLRAETQ